MCTYFCQGFPRFIHIRAAYFYALVVKHWRNTEVLRVNAMTNYNPQDDHPRTIMYHLFFWKALWFSVYVLQPPQSLVFGHCEAEILSEKQQPILLVLGDLDPQKIGALSCAPGCSEELELTKMHAHISCANSVGYASTNKCFSASRPIYFYPCFILFLSMSIYLSLSASIYVYLSICLPMCICDRVARRGQCITRLVWCISQPAFEFQLRYFWRNLSCCAYGESIQGVQHAAHAHAHAVLSTQLCIVSLKPCPTAHLSLASSSGRSISWHTILNGTWIAGGLPTEMLGWPVRKWTWAVGIFAMLLYWLWMRWDLWIYGCHHTYQTSEWPCPI